MDYIDNMLEHYEDSLTLTPWQPKHDDHTVAVAGLECEGYYGVGRQGATNVSVDVQYDLECEHVRVTLRGGDGYAEGVALSAPTAALMLQMLDALSDGSWHLAKVADMAHAVVSSAEDGHHAIGSIDRCVDNYYRKAMGVER